jgi:hypothetical protein
MATGARPFNALTGQEVKKIVVAEVKRTIAEDSRWLDVYSLLSWRFKIAFSVYPNEPKEFAIDFGPFSVKLRANESPEVIVNEIRTMP